MFRFGLQELLMSWGSKSKFISSKPALFSYLFSLLLFWGHREMTEKTWSVSRKKGFLTEINFWSFWSPFKVQHERVEKFPRVLSSFLVPSLHFSVFLLSHKYRCLSKTSIISHLPDYLRPLLFLRWTMLWLSVIKEIGPRNEREEEAEFIKSEGLPRRANIWEIVVIAVPQKRISDCEHNCSWNYLLII